MFLPQNVCFGFHLQSLSEIFLIIRRIQRDIMTVHRSACKVTSFLSHFNETLISRQIFEKYSPKFPVWKDGQTDMTNLIVSFRSFVNAPKIKTAEYTRHRAWPIIAF